MEAYPTTYLVIDIEADSMDVDKANVHCVVAREVGVEGDAGLHVFRPDEIEDACAFLNASRAVLIGHNIVEYDIPILQRYGLRADVRLADTKLASRAAYPGHTLAVKDSQFCLKQPEFPRELVGWHSLEAWGWRLGEPKGESPEDWLLFTEDMLRYCIQDVDVTEKLWLYLIKRLPLDAVFLETRVGSILRKMRLRGVRFNEERAVELMVALTEERESLEEELRALFPPVYVKDGPHPTVPKRTQQSRKALPGEVGYRNLRFGCAYSKVKLEPFNPGSRDQIAKRLTALYGWEPMEFTKGGSPSITDDILADLDYEHAPKLARYLVVTKVLGFISEGDNAWLKLCKGGYIHGRMNVTGTVTMRASHHEPNLGQVPSVTKPLGKECRELFIPTEGETLLGVDASGLQLRVLAHYLARYDGGAFAEAVMHGDPHTYMMKGTGILTRAKQKTWTYAKLFGAGNYKLGTIIIDDLRLAKESGLYSGPVPALASASRLGKESNQKLAQYMTGLDKLEKALKKAARRGWLRTLDGRRVPVLSQHRALNTLLMAGEAIVMKQAMVLAEELDWGGSRPVLWVHDEWQCEVTATRAARAGKVLKECITQAGAALGLRCELSGDMKVGDSWMETH